MFLSGLVGWYLIGFLYPNSRFLCQRGKPDQVELKNQAWTLGDLSERSGVCNGEERSQGGVSSPMVLTLNGADSFFIP